MSFWCCSCFAKTYEAPEVLELDYRHSSLNEVPPDVFTYERTLEKLDLGCNQISDLPPSLFHCHELRELDLCDNDLMCIPPAIGSLTRLTRLDLSRNAIADVADTVKNCKSLTYLDLSLNHLQKLPEGISQLVNLEELFLNDTYLEFLHANFGRLTKLKVLELRENSLQTLPKSMNRLHNLQRIDIGQNDISEMPEVIGTMTNLVEVWCDNNSIRTIPKFIGNLGKLNCLDASQNDIQEISEEICRCSQLSDLTLASNTLESLPDSFPKLENLSVLRLDSNSIQYLPEDFGNLKNLQELSLIRNLLKSLPASVGLMRKLRTLYLDDNLLTELPKEIGSCSALSILSVAKNRLYVIPSEVGHLSNLKVLTVAGNLLVHLPVSILNITKLNALWLSESQSKPMLPLNKEIDAATGQHVLTCYLLPQMPSTHMTETDTTTDNEEPLPPRRSRPSIKFLTDAEPQPTDNNLGKRGLLRAPTPYPKELRALAKHASHLRNKDQNGDVIINDEPEYEGDYIIGDEDGQEIRSEDVRKNPLNGDLFYGPQSQQPALPAKDYLQNDSAAINNASERSYSSNIAGPQVPLLPVETILTNIELTNKRSVENIHHFPTQTNISLIEPYPSIVSSEETPFLKHDVDTASNKKGPPPYHVAARRAAFFRSTPSTSPVGPSSPLSINPSRKSPVFPTKAHQMEIMNGQSTGGKDLHVNSSFNIPMTPSNNSMSGDNHSMGAASEGFNEDKFSVQNQLHESRGKPEGRGFVPPPDKPDGIWNTSVQATTERVSGDKESRIIEEIIDASKMHASAREMTDIVENSSSIINKYEFSDNQVTQVQNLEKIIKKITNTTTVDELRKSDLISTIEMSLKQDQEEDRNGVQEKAHSNWDNRQIDSNPGFGKSTVQSSGNNGDMCKNNSSIRRTTDYNKQESSDTGLSSSESFSRIPVLSPSKIAAVPTISEAAKVPQKQMQVLSKLPQISNNSNVSSSISSPQNRNMMDQSANSNIGWTRIPKGPSNSTNADMVVNAKTDTPSASVAVASKPSVMKTLSGSRIPGIPLPPGSEVKVGKTIAPQTTPATTNFNKGASNTPVSPTTHPVTSPTGSSRIPRFGDNQSSHPTVVEHQSQHPDSTNKLERTLSGSRIPKFNEGPKLPPLPDTHLQKFSNKSETTNPIDQAAPVNPGSNPVSKIPTVAARKPWIFGTHRNARVVPVEYTKVNTLGFTVTDGPLGSNAGDGNGIYVDSIEAHDSTVKVGDKILQVDGIDVSNMGVDIVRKILSNCQENIHLLVSRHY